MAHFWFFFQSVSSCLFDIYFSLAVFGDILDSTSMPLGTDHQNKEGQKSAPKSTQKAKERDKDKDKLTSKSSSIMEQVSTVYVCLCMYFNVSIESHHMFKSFAPIFSCRKSFSREYCSLCFTEVHISLPQGFSFFFFSWNGSRYNV